MQANTQHTPGPWKVTGTHENKVAALKPNGEEFPIADCSKACNARLIAAAPETAAERDRLKTINAELLEALRNMTTWLSDSDDAMDMCLCSAARAAIAKAAMHI